MNRVRYFRRVKGVITEKGETDAGAFNYLQRTKPGEYFALSDTDPDVVLPPIPPPNLPVPEPSKAPSLEDLTAAVIALSKGDKSVIDAIDKKLKRGKAGTRGTDPRAAAKRSARRNKATPK